MAKIQAQGVDNSSNVTNTTLISLNATTIATIPTTTLATTQATVTAKDECSTNSTICKNNGDCFYDENKNKKCKCNDKYSGTNCELRSCTKEDGVTNQCLNEGECLINIDTKDITCKIDMKTPF